LPQQSHRSLPLSIRARRSLRLPIVTIDIVITATVEPTNIETTINMSVPTDKR
jgi:hypothetical protein